MSDESGANAQLAQSDQPPSEVVDSAAPTIGAPKETVAAPEVKTNNSALDEESVSTAGEAAKPVEEPVEPPSEKPTETADTDMTDAPEPAPPADPAASAAEPASAQPEDAAPMPVNDAATAASVGDKSKARRKSTNAGGNKGKKLNKKGSKARILHLDAKPGDHFYVKLKGHPQWPVVVCDDDMLPLTLINTRPVTAAKNGVYGEAYKDGGKRAADRTFPVMYLATNEFSWVRNSDLHDLDPEKALDAINEKMRKDLKEAHKIASEAHDLSYYKDILQKFQEALEEEVKAQLQAQSTPAKKSKKSKAAAEDDEDLEMADAADEGEPAKSKKRKAEEGAVGLALLQAISVALANFDQTPQRSDSVKKPKIKITSNSTPKTANGVPTPKSAKASESKPSKVKSKKEGKTEDKKADKEAQTPKEPELSPEEKHQRKEKEVLFLRHKLQKGLLTRDQEPKEEEMKMMSEYITKLEAFPDLEVSIIRATKINKVLKAILKLASIPKEEEFNFKPRSQVLLDKWNKLLAVDETPASAGLSATTNGVNGKASEATASKEEPPKVEKTGSPNGVKENGEVAASEKAEEPTAPVEERSENPADEASKVAETVGTSA